MALSLYSRPLKACPLAWFFRIFEENDLFSNEFFFSVFVNNSIIIDTEVILIEIKARLIVF